MKNIRKSTIVFASVIMLSLMMSIIFLGNRVEAKDLAKGGVSVAYTSIDDYYGKQIPEYQTGYVFAGWYEDEECTVSYVKKDGETGKEVYYAKFVPKNVLSVKAQNETKLLNTILSDKDTGQIRFVTSVDSLNYKEVGFYVTGQIGEVYLDGAYSTRKVYTYLYAAGTQKEESEGVDAATVFGTPASEFFAAQAFKIRLDQFGDDFTVTPYWITPDGLRVDGEKRTRSMIDNLEADSYVEVDKRAYYKMDDLYTIAGEIKTLKGTEESPTVVTLLKDVVISNQTSFAGNTKIVNKPEKVRISKADNWGKETNACLFYTSGNTLVIAGTKDSESITIDGKNEKSLIRNSATFEAVNVTFTNGNRSDTIGGAINADSGKSTIINRCAFVNNKANQSGGAIYVKNGNLQVIDSKFDRNYATTSHGGAIAIVNSVENSSITNTAFYNNEAQEKSGGALWVEKTTLDIKSCEFGKADAANTAKDNGGAIYVTDSGVVNLTADSQRTFKSLNNNTATSGGAIMVIGKSASANVTGYTFDGNTATNFGGAIRCAGDGATLIVNSCDFKNNTVTSPSSTSIVGGGAIYTVKDTQVTNSTFESNKAKNGGAILANDTEKAVTLTGCEFKENEADAGGAVYAQVGAQGVTSSECTFDSNSVTTNGGAVYAEAAVEILSGIFSSNSATVNGGAAFVKGGTTASNIIDTEFYGNSSDDTKNGGGALWVESTTVNVKSCEFGKQDMPNTTKAHGGAIFVYADGKVNLTVDSEYPDHHSLSFNKAGASGGAIMINGSGASVTISGYTFTQNVATTSGGAIRYCNGTEALFLKNCQFDQNEAKVAAAAAGGAIYAQKELKVEECNFNENKALGTNARGGAIYAVATLTVNGGTYAQNKCAGYGGAIAQGSGTGTVNNVTFQNNKAIQAGGAVGCVGATLTLMNCDFTDNTADKTGGAACITTSGKITIKITDTKSHDFKGNADPSDYALYAKAGTIEYSSLYGDVASGTEGTGKVTKITP